MTDSRHSAADGEEPLAKVVDLHTREIRTGVRVTYTVSEVAAMLGISRATTYVLLRTGEIPARRIGSRWIIACRRFNAWLDSDPGRVEQ